MKTTDAIKHFGSVKALAEALGITRHAIYQWPASVPLSRQFEIELKSGGALRAAAGCRSLLKSR